ncbi:MAG: hypothetical protein KDD70_14935 [Bdellovibrionales bacterium]|nr:hypothetical protein [Bdellovibrionales bacterium]
MSKDTDSPKLKERESEANTCMAIGAGVGVMGVAATVLLGATCPICYVAAPALIGTGLLAKKRAEKGTKK